MKKIGIIITTFQRDELLFKSIESIKANWQDNFELIIVDQTNEPENLTYKKFYFSSLITKQIHYEWKRVPYNSGLSYCRNFGVQKANELGCDYCLIASDSFLFNESVKKINHIVNILDDTWYDLIGMELSGCVCDWEARLKLIESESFELDFINKIKSLSTEYLTEATPSIEWENEDGSPALIGDVIHIHDCDIMRNFFIAKTATLLDVQWDNNLKLGEHEDFFWRYKQEGYKCGWTNYIDAEKMKDRPDEYTKLRKINFNAGLAYLRKKYNMSGWVTYKNLSRAKIGLFQKKGNK